MSAETTLETARAWLAEVYRPDGVEIWLHSRNKMLGGDVALDLIARGEGDRVLAAIDILRTGSHA
jgi:hypothetical protein